jgi:hypothetical protein
MRDVVCQPVGEALEQIAILDLAEAGVKARTDDAVRHMERAIEMFRLANVEVEAARMHLSKGLFDIRVRGLMPWPDADEMILRVTAARAALKGEDGPGIRRRKAREKQETAGGQ